MNKNCCLTCEVVSSFAENCYEVSIGVNNPGAFTGLPTENCKIGTLPAVVTNQIKN